AAKRLTPASSSQSAVAVPTTTTSNPSIRAASARACAATGPDRSARGGPPPRPMRAANRIAASRPSVGDNGSGSGSDSVPAGRRSANPPATTKFSRQFGQPKRPSSTRRSATRSASRTSPHSGPHRGHVTMSVSGTNISDEQLPLRVLRPLGRRLPDPDVQERVRHVGGEPGLELVPEVARLVLRRGLHLPERGQVVQVGVVEVIGNRAQLPLHIHE